jgi:hypothetical protein
MLLDKKLEEQSTFKLNNDGNWYTEDWEYSIINYMGEKSLCFHNPVIDSHVILKENIQTLEELDSKFNEITGNNLKFI